jgi:hypothetical protein
MCAFLVGWIAKEAAKGRWWCSYMDSEPQAMI